MGQQLIKGHLFLVTDKGMLKKILAKLLQKGFLGFKMGIEGGATNIGLINQLLNGDFFIALLI